MAWRLISAEANSDCSALLRTRESLLDILGKKAKHFFFNKHLDFVWYCFVINKLRIEVYKM